MSITRTAAWKYRCRGQTSRPVGIRTSFSAVRVRVPNNASYAVAAKTSFGKIRSDFPMTISGDISADSLNRNIGGGGCPGGSTITTEAFRS